MRIKESRIRQIIKEEASRVIREASDDLPGPKFPPGSVKRPGLGAFGNFEPPDGWDDEEGSAAEEDGAARWVVSNAGYELHDAPRDVAEAWEAFTEAVKGLERFMDDTYPDTEADGEPVTVGEIAVHQAQTFLTER